MLLLCALAALVCTRGTGAARAADETSYPKWSTIELTFNGPNSEGRSEPNPFAVRLDAIFTSPSGSEFTVPGFYDGDGRGGLDGNLWKVRFSADEVGKWSWRTTSSQSLLSGRSGSFIVTAVPDEAVGFWRWGRLEYTGTPENGIRYLKFRDGPYWLKAGCDDPENFLGRSENYDTPFKRGAAIDYLAQRGISSLYMMTHNIDGDDKDVWPWLGETAREAKANGGRNARFDIARLREWRELFEYMQSKGVVPYLVLEDDSVWSDYDHQRYWREIIARFGDLPALLLNMGEEHNENYSLAEGLEMARRLKELDPYDHPRGIHNVSRAREEYVESPHVDFTSIQTGQPGRRGAVKEAVEHNQIAADWIEQCRERRRRVLVVNFDEGRPELDRRAYWSAYLGGGVWEAHVPAPFDAPPSAWEPLWTELGGARAFMESVPFWEMAPHNELVKHGQAFCLAKPSEVYALYLPSGGAVTVDLPQEGTFEAAWWNPDNGREGAFGHRSEIGGGTRQLRAPGSGDWALRIARR